MVPAGADLHAMIRRPKKAAAAPAAGAGTRSTEVSA